MKGLKIFAVVVGALAVLCALALVLALTPAVQTWAVRKAVAGQPGMTLEIGRVAAGFSQADIKDLRLTKDGMVVTASGASARYSLMDYLSHKRLNVDQFTAEDLVIDLRNAGPAAGMSPKPASTAANAPAASSPVPSSSTRPAAVPAKPPGAPFQGLLNQAQLPYEVRLASIAVKGRALLNNEQTVTFDLKGGGIETGQKGKLEWTAQFADALRDAPLQSARMTGTTEIQINAERRIVLATIDATVVASGPKLPSDPLKLEAKAEQSSSGGNELYSVRLGTLRGATVEPVLSGSAQFTPAAREIAGTWELALRSEQLGAVLAGLNLPTVAARGSGKFSVKPDTTAIAASGNVEGQVTELEKLSPALGVVGTVQFATGFDGSLADQIARLERLELNLTGANGRKLAEVATLQRVTYSLADQRATLADPKAQLGRISLQALPLAWAQPFVSALTIDSGELSVALVVEADNDGSHLRVRAAEPLALRGVTLRQGTEKLVEQLTLTLRPNVDYSAARIVAEFADINVSMPAGDALTGRLTADVTDLSTTPAIAFTSQLQAKVVAALKPYLPVDLGPLDIAVSTEGRLAGPSLQLSKASLSAKRADNSLLLVAETRQQISADFQKQTYSVPQPNATAAHVQFGSLPLAWAQAFVPNSKFDGVVAGGALDLSFRTTDDIGVNTTEPLVLRGISVALEGKPQIQALDAFADLTASKRGNVIGYEVRRVELKQGEASLALLSVTGEVRLGDKLNVAAKGKFEADAAALMNQPALAPFATLSRGKIAAVFEGNLADAIQAKAAISARDLVAREKNQPLGSLEISVVANLKPDGSGTLTAPLTLTNAGRKSDLTVEGTFGRSATAMLFTGKITSSQLIVDDFEPLAALAPSKPAAAPPTPSKPTAPAPAKPVAKRDEKPFWAGVNGKLDVDLKNVLYGRDYTIRAIRGAAVITDGRLALEGLQGQFKENPFKLAGEVKFNAQQPKPYTLAGAVDVSGLELGEILRAANPNERPAIESKVTVTSKLNGNGATLSDLVEGTYGSFDVTGGSGVLRALGKKGQTVNALSSAIGILGAIRGSDTTLAIADLTSAFNELKFDSFKMHVERGEDLNLKVSALEFISPFMRTTGTGGITKQGTEPIQNQPMRFDLAFAAKDQLALLLTKAGLLSDKQDEKGYYTMARTFTIGGTPAKPDSGLLWKIIGEAAARSLLR